MKMNSPSRVGPGLYANIGSQGNGAIGITREALQRLVGQTFLSAIDRLQ